MNTDQLSEALSHSLIHDLYKRMLRIRFAEEEVRQVCLKGENIKCSPHLSHGQEAVAAGVCANLKRGDSIFSSHRPHGHYLGAYGNLNKFFAEMYGKKTGCSSGKGGEMHLFDKDVGFLGSSSIVGGSAPIATGAALGIKQQKQHGLIVSFFGDSALEEGSTYEGMNFAALKNLPIVFVVENNGYAIFSPLNKRQKYDNAYKRYEYLGIKGIRVDGNNVLEVYNKTNQLFQKVRSGDGPFLMECITYRTLGHAGPHPDDQIGYRTKEEIECWIANCPIKNLETYMSEKNIIDEKQKESLCDELIEQIKKAVKYAEDSPFPSEEDLLSDVISKRRIVI